GNLDVVWHIVVVGIAVVEESAVLDEESARIDRSARLRMPAHWRNTGHPPDRLDRSCNGLALVRFFHAGMRFPAPAMAADLVAARDGIPRQPRHAFEGAGAGIQGHRYPRGLDHAHNTAVAYPHAILVVRFHAEVGGAPHFLAHLVHRFIALIACGERKLPALLAISHDPNCKPCRPRPGNGPPTVP